MNYTTEYLTRQLEEAKEVSSDLNARLKADPGNLALEIVALSMNDHVEEIRRDLDVAANTAKPTSDEPSGAAVATYLCKVLMVSTRGAIDLELSDGRVLHGNYPHGLFGKIRNIRLGDQLKCTVNSNTLLDLEPVMA